MGNKLRIIFQKNLYSTKEIYRTAPYIKIAYDRIGLINYHTQF